MAEETATETPPRAGASAAKRKPPHPAGKLSPVKARAWEDELRGRLGLLPLGVSIPDKIRMWSWIVTALTGLLAAVTRFVNLDHPHQMVFDETYYVKGGYSLITYGYEGDWVGENSDEMFVQGLDAARSIGADYVVHPPFGKWLIGFGQALFGTDNGYGWRFAVALAGVIGVLLVTRIAFRMFRSVGLAALAGTFMALDGMGITLSRVGILDNLVMIFGLAGFWAVLKDRDHNRALLAHRIAHGDIRADGSPRDAWGPRIWWRPWLLLAGTFLGLCCGVKWSGAYAIAVFGIAVFLWDTFARRAAGVRMWVGAGIFRGGIPAFFNLVPIALVMYVAAWTSWFLNPNGYKRNWAAEQREAGVTDYFADFLPDSLSSLAEYHRQMWDFHTGLAKPHTYMSQAEAWIIQYRPVSFYFPPREKLIHDCGAERCVQAITSIGNVAVWWMAAIAVIAVLIYAIWRSDWRAWAILAGYAAFYLPWFQYRDRTIYQFYAVAFLPYVVLALAFGIAIITRIYRPPRLESRPIGAVLAPFNLAWYQKDVDDADHDGPPPPDQWPPNQHGSFALRLPTGWAVHQLWPRTKKAKQIVAVVLLLVVLVFLFWWPLWTGTTVPHWFWKAHMWLPGWT